MSNRYHRNRIYMTATDQETILHTRLLVVGCGIGSNIAECCLRLGFEQLTLLDGDIVEDSNLNRQNYEQQNIGQPKSVALQERLLAISPNARINVGNTYLTPENFKDHVRGHDIAVNALDFNSTVPFLFDHYCQQLGIPVIHPYNIGWATILFVILPQGPGLSMISPDPGGFEKKAVRFFLSQLHKPEQDWIHPILQAYEAENPIQSPPQLAVASWLAGGAATELAFRLATGKKVNPFPQFYFVSLTSYNF